MGVHSYTLGLCGFGPLYNQWLAEQINSMKSFQVVHAGIQPASFRDLKEDLKLILLQMKSKSDQASLIYLRKETGLPVIVWWAGKELAVEEMIQVLNAGASAFLTDQHDLEDICRAVRDVASGKIHLNNLITSALYQYCRRNEIIHAAGEQSHSFSEREIHLMELKKTGRTSKEIGEILFLSRKTVENIFYNLYRKFECRNFFELNTIYGHWKDANQLQIQ